MTDKNRSMNANAEKTILTPFYKSKSGALVYNEL